MGSNTCLQAMSTIVFVLEKRSAKIAFVGRSRLRKIFEKRNKGEDHEFEGCKTSG